MENFETTAYCSPCDGITPGPYEVYTEISVDNEVLYNIMFILPLLVIFGLASFGVHSRKLAGFGRRHTGKTKIILATILFILAALLLTLG